MDHYTHTLIEDERAALADEERAEREAEHARRGEERERHRAIDQQIDGICGGARALTAGALLVGGYHTHRGQWRKRRDVGAERRTRGVPVFGLPTSFSA
jgi:hypothetical protein